MENFECDGLCFCPDGFCQKKQDLNNSAVDKPEENNICCSGGLQLPDFSSFECGAPIGYSELEKDPSDFEVAKRKFLAGQIFTLPEDTNENLKAYYRKQGAHIMQAFEKSLPYAEHHCLVNVRNKETENECFIFSTRILGVYKSVAMDITQFNFID